MGGMLPHDATAGFLSDLSTRRTNATGAPVRDQAFAPSGRGDTGARCGQAASQASMAPSAEPSRGESRLERQIDDFRGLLHLSGKKHVDTQNALNRLERFVSS